LAELLANFPDKIAGNGSELFLLNQAAILSRLANFHAQISSGPESFLVGAKMIVVAAFGRVRHS